MFSLSKTPNMWEMTQRLQKIWHKIKTVKQVQIA